MSDLRKLPLLPAGLVGVLVSFSWLFDHLLRSCRFFLFVRSARAELVVLSQGGNMDGLFYAKRLRNWRVPYCLIVQKAAEMYWPSDSQLADLQACYRDARRIFFVSEHNLRLTEQQLAMRLPQAEVVRNPFLVPWDSVQPWPAEAAPLRLACIGRLYPREKGQDILLRTLASEKWRRRQLHVTFFGTGLHDEALRQMADFLGLENVTFAGFIDRIADVWRDHHGLVLPSHCEGLPLVLVEAMLSGRVAIVTDVAGHREVLSDGATGFLAGAPTDHSLDEALERAWQARSRLQSIGEAAARAIRELVPPSPETVFAERLLAVMDEGPAAAESGTVVRHEPMAC